MITVQLPVEIETKLTNLAEKQHKSKSDIIKEALDNLFYKEQAEKYSYELGEKYFGQYGSRDGTLSVTYKSKLKGKINAKINSH